MFIELRDTGNWLDSWGMEEINGSCPVEFMLAIWEWEDMLAEDWIRIFPWSEDDDMSVWLTLDSL